MLWQCSLQCRDHRISMAITNQNRTNRLLTINAGFFWIKTLFQTGIVIVALGLDYGHCVRQAVRNTATTNLLSNGGRQRQHYDQYDSSTPSRQQA